MKARIRLILDHDPIITPRMRKMIWNKETTEGLIANRQRIHGYIDDFGRYVYVQPFFDWEGVMEDEDRRYRGVDDAPNETINTEEYDLCSWPSADQPALHFQGL